MTKRKKRMSLIFRQSDEPGSITFNWSHVEVSRKDPGAKKADKKDRKKAVKEGVKLKKAAVIDKTIPKTRGEGDHNDEKVSMGVKEMKGDKIMGA